MNILNIRNKSMIIVQLKKKLMFEEVYSNLNDFNEAYLFYEGSKKMTKNEMLEAGNHFIFYYSKLIGGSGKPPKSDEDYEEDDYEDDYDEDYKTITTTITMNCLPIIYLYVKLMIN
jgi:hypothetical protein